MKITGTKSSITFDMEDGYIVKAAGELLINNTFVIDKNSMTHWEPPFEGKAFTKKDMETVIQTALKLANESTVQFIFD